MDSIITSGGSGELQQTLRFTGTHREHRRESRVFNNHLAAPPHQRWLLPSATDFTLPGNRSQRRISSGSREPKPPACHNTTNVTITINTLHLFIAYCSQDLGSDRPPSPTTSSPPLTSFAIWGQVMSLL